ncbi:MAG: hypothetical protein IJ424_04735 [Oscillospiraceae bacterium]|nr:hypothetical protein [Oscillospiraceae bacterium]
MRDEYSNEDSLRTMLYGLARCGLFFLLNIFAVVMGRWVILSVVSTLIPRLHLYNKPELVAFMAWLIPAFTLIALFADDAKRHTAYGRYNVVNVSITMILTAAVYYAPVFVLEYLEDRNAIAALRSLYYTSSWMEIFTDNIQVYALIGTIIQVVLCIVSYIIARKYYLKKFESGEYEYEYDR